jgi:tetratricopeptide (TPR) repeat protein
MQEVGAGHDRSWQQADDETVETRLRELLAQAQSLEDPREVLGAEEGATVRSAFLEATRAYHPNRFARRPEEIRRLATEYFLLLKQAHDKIQSEERDAKLSSLRDSARRKPVPRARPQAEGDSAARDSLRKKRQEEVRKRLQRAQTAEPTRRPTAQIRAAQPPPDDASADEERFEEAQRLLQCGELEEASAIFRDLAVARTQDKRFRLYMHYSQGRIHQRDGNHDEARSEYKRALGLDASFEHALQSMASLPDGARRKGGIFSKIFGK